MTANEQYVNDLQKEIDDYLKYKKPPENESNPYFTWYFDRINQIKIYSKSLGKIS